MSQLLKIRTENLKAFHGDQAVKDKYLGRVRAHRAADEIQHGFYWEKRGGVFKGCAVGCTLHSSDHSAYEDELGIPTQLAFIQDRIFERLSPPDDVLFPEQFLEAISVGADLYPAYWRFMIFALSDETHGLIPVITDAEVKDILGKVVAMYQNALDGVDISQSDFDALRRDALDALAARAARAALDALAALAARAARAALAALDALDALAALAALDALALVWRDQLLKFLREAK